MKATTYTAARQNLASIMQGVCDDHAPVIITRQKSEAVVMISLDDYNSMVETSYLLGNPVNAEILRKSIANAEAGNVTEVSLDDLESL